MNFKRKKCISSLLVTSMLLSNAATMYGNVPVQSPKLLAISNVSNGLKEYIINAAFDNGLTGWENPGWAEGTNLLATLDPANGVNGSACAQLTGNKAIEQTLKGVQARTTYILKVKAKGTGKVEIGVGDKSKQTFDLTNEYKEISITFRTDDNGYARIYAYVPDGATAYVDDFKVELSPVSTIEGGTVSILPENQLQTFDGWGTSLVWFGNVIGGWSEENRKQISDLLFDPDKGLGLNIVRYNIGGGDDPGHNHMRPGGEVEGFATSMNSDGTLNYNWNADSNQIKMLEDAITRGVDITEAFSNTPPYFMTKSGCASGSTDGASNNLKDDSYSQFADYLTEVVEYFKDKKGITFDYLEPLNEPDTSYWKANGGQEGCHFSPSSQEEIIKLTNESLEKKGLLKGIRVAAMDESIIDTGLRNFKGFSQETKDMMEKWNVHTYGGSQRKETKNAAAMQNKDLWMSEVDLGGTGTHNPDSMLPAIDFADRVLYDMKHIQPTAWVIWQAVENWPNMMPTIGDKKGENSNWGLILANFEGEGVKGLEAEAYRTTKKYYSMMQYTKFIKPGSVMLQVDNDSTVAFYDKANKKLVVVYINKSDTDNKNVRFDLQGFNSIGSTAKKYVTADLLNCEQVEDVAITKGVLTNVVDRQSITTYVIEDAVYDDAVIKLNESTITDEKEANRFKYIGDWGYTANDGEYVSDHVWSTDIGDTATLSFTGKNAQVYGIKAPNHGIAKITVDKGTENQSIQEIDLYQSYRESNAVIFDTSNLAIPLVGGKHTIDIEVTGKKNNESSGVGIVVDYAKVAKDGNIAVPVNKSFKSGEEWYDTEGKRIQAHGGGMWYDQQAKKYYWYGEDKTYGYRPLRGVRCYSSTDLYNWEDHGLALSAIENRAELDTNELYKNRSEEDKKEIFRDLDKNTAVMERPKVIYNEKTNKWVMWFHADGPTDWSTADYAKAEAGVAISDSPTGPFTYIRSYRLDQDPDPSRTNQGMARDMNLFVDDDGTGYIIYSSEENGTMYISKLTDDYLDVVGWHKDGLKDENGSPIRDKSYKGVEGLDYIRIFDGWAREAPAMFKYDDKYYLMTSGCTGWAPNQAKYAMADSVFGTWKEMGDPCVGDTSKTTFDSQSTYVIPVDSENGKYIYMGDRWFSSQLVDSRYIWLPIKFQEEGKMEISWMDEWTLDTLDTMGKMTIVTELPEFVEYGVIPQLPTNIQVQDAGVIKTTEVIWDLDQDDFNKVGKIEVKGSLSTGESVQTDLYVVPKNVLYFVNSGNNVSAEYTKIKEYIGETLINKTVRDQELKGNDWGYTGSTDIRPYNWGSIYEDLRFVKSDASSRDIAYTFKTLEPGKYTVYLGFYDPWAEYAKGNRKAAIVINGEEKQTDLNIDGVERTYQYADIEVAEDLTVTIKPVNTGSNSDVQVSWLMISKQDVAVNIPSIEVTPQGPAEGIIDKVLVSLKAAAVNGGTVLEYKLGDEGEWTTYTGIFELTKNTTIYGRAKDQQGNVSQEVKSIVNQIPDKGQYTVSGQVTPGATGITSVDGLEVKLYTQQGEFVASGITLNGTYVIQKIKDGVYVAKIAARLGSYKESSVAITVNGADISNANITLLSGEKVLQTIQSPDAIRNIENGTPIEQIELPDQVVIVTNNGNENAGVIWDRTNTSYDTTLTTEQTFEIVGTVTLPTDVLQPEVPIALEVKMSITVNAKRETSQPYVTMSGVGEVTGGHGFDVEVGIEQIEQKVYAEDIVITFDENLLDFKEVQGLGSTQVIEKNEEAGKIRVLLFTQDGIVSKEPILKLNFMPITVNQTTQAAIRISDVSLGVVSEDSSLQVKAEGASKVIEIKPVAIEIDKTQLQATIQEAESVSSQAVVGNQIGQYPQAAKTALEAAITVARTVFDTSQVQSEIDAARETLRSAIETFEASRNKGEEDLNKDQVVDIADIALVAYYYQVSVGSPEWAQAQKADLNKDGKVDIQDLILVAIKMLRK